MDKHESIITFKFSQTFNKQEDYQKHLVDAHSQTIFKCEICSEIFDTKVAIQVHFAVNHLNEIRLYRCSACMEIFRSEREFRHHVRSRHVMSGALQCIFCRAICSSELEMHFHLAAHARQYRCPLCPESFHVEFLLDRHLQTHHTQKELNGSVGYHHSNQKVSNNNEYTHSHAHSHQQQLSTATKSSPYSFINNKIYNPLQIDTISAKHPNLLHGLYDSISKNQRYPSSSEGPGNGYISPTKGLLGIYSHPEMVAKLNNFYSISQLTTTSASTSTTTSTSTSSSINQANLVSRNNNVISTGFQLDKGYSCGMCDRSDFSTETEVHTHRKLVHNLKTGVSLRCAYCNGDFRSR